LPDVELSFGSAVNVHVPGGAMSGCGIDPVAAWGDNEAGPAVPNGIGTEMGAKSPGATSRRGLGAAGSAACAAVALNVARMQSAHPDSSAATRGERRTAWVITPPMEVVVECAARCMRAGARRAGVPIGFVGMAVSG